ncbi:MAG: nucleoside triphosphate pyrophosphohydrolase, partial [Candidatus Acidiferrales bacterium]
MSRQFEDLVALQTRLLDPNGCPWDREQTHESLRTYLLEEAYEVLETIDAGDYAKLPDELGDLLLQVVFHAELARRAGRFDIGDVVERIHEKLVRRHPHVFGEVRAETAGEVVKNWEQLKVEERKAEKGEHAAGVSLLDDIPRSLPAAHEAYQLTRRASRIGFDWDDLEGLLDKLKEEAAELRSAMNEENAARREEEIGDLLFVAVNVARFLHVDPEIALKKANRKFQQRFRAMERQAARTGRKLADVPRDEMERLWNQAKQQEKAG